jgi:hypothetical protein
MDLGLQTGPISNANGINLYVRLPHVRKALR